MDLNEEDFTPEEHFPEFDTENQMKLHNFMYFMRNFTDRFLLFQFVVSMIGIVSNIVHVGVLSRKEMRSSSTNIIMIGLAFYDIGLMINRIDDFFRKIATTGSTCVPPRSPAKAIFEILAVVLDDSFRCSTSWLAVLMVAVRTISVIKATDKRFDILCEAKCGWFIIALVTCLSSSIGVLHYFSYETLTFEESKNGFMDYDAINQCSSNAQTVPENYVYIFEKLFLLKKYLLLNGIVSKIIPSISFPILTALLVVALRKNRRNHKDIVTTSERNAEKGDRTTILVLYIAISFMIAELPQGICKLVEVSFYGNVGFTFITGYFNEIFVLVSFFNAASHGIICYAMSSNYRRNFKHLLFFRWKKKKMFRSGKNSTASVARILR